MHHELRCGALPLSMHHHASLFQPLAVVLLEAPVDELVTYLRQRLRMPRRFAEPLVQYFLSIRSSMLDHELLVHRLCQSPKRGLGKSWWEIYYAPIRTQLVDWLSRQVGKKRWQAMKVPAPQMQAGWEAWPIPPITTLGGLASFFLSTLEELDTLADVRELQRHIPLGHGHHYRYRWVDTRRGKKRLLEIPKQRLRHVQQLILTQLLNHVPPHTAAHGFRRHHSILTNAQQHLQQEVVVSFDLADFFPSIHFNRVMAIFRRIGYPRTVARYLAAICTKATPYEVWQQHPQYQSQPSQWQKIALYRERHLPQGAPSSPALANLAAYHLDLRLHTLAQSQGWHYTRYADDFTFSGDRDLVRSRLSLMTLVASIVESEGFRINLKKTHVMHQSQRQEVCGVVVNENSNVRRCEFDQLKAILHNCIRHGPVSQNRQNHPHFQEHLRGRIAVLSQFHPSRGAKMLSLWQQIAW